MRPLFHLIGLPTDINSSFERGAAAGPAAIADALWSDRGNISCENGMEVGIDFRIEDKGLLPLAEKVEQDDQLIIQSVKASLSAGATPLMLGGDHSVTYPILLAVHDFFGPVTILHFDAHSDLYHEFEGNPRSHASPFARIMEQGLAAHLIQVGIRTATRHCRDQAQRFGVDVIEMRNFKPESFPEIAGPVYLSFDLDALDPSVAPGVAHPEPGGLALRDCLTIFDRISGPIVAADIVELNPARDIGSVTAIVAAKLIREIASRAVANADTLSNRS